MINKFFKHSLFRNTAIFIGFCLMNILIFLLFILFLSFSQLDTVYYQRTSLTDIENSIAGSGMSRQRLDEEMRENDTFFFLLNEEGEVIDSSNLPSSIPSTFTRAQIASFTRWYLNDHPVDTRILDSGEILVEGYPENSLAKYSLTFPVESVILDFLFFPGLLLINLLIFLYFLFREQKKIKREMIPILQGIENLSNGTPVSLDESGILSAVKKSINRLSTLLRRREKMRSEWISEVSHDIRTPLSVIATSSELMEKEPENLPTYKKRIQLNILRIRTLVESLNLNNKLTYGLLPVQKKDENLASVLRESVIRFIESNEMDAFPLNIDISRESESVTTSIDKALFERVIYNLLANCLIHNPGGVPINITLSTIENETSLLVSNPRNSMGSDNSCQIGQGLLYVQKFAQEHGWEVEINDGEIFRVVLSFKQKP